MEVCSAGSRESGGEGGTRREARGAGGRRARAEERPAAGTEAGLQGLPSRDLPRGVHQPPRSALGRSFRSGSPGSCLVFVFLRRARGLPEEEGDFFFFFSSLLN